MASKKQWEEWKQDPKIEAWQKNKVLAGKRRLERKMEFTASLQRYEKFAQKVHDHTVDKAWKELAEEEVIDTSIEFGYIRIVLVFMLIVGFLTSGLYYLST